jgi:hypothetical protein
MKPINRLFVFLYSTPNIIGAVLGLIGLLLFFSGIIKRYWFLIVVGLYLIGFVATPRSKQVKLRMAESIQRDRILTELQQLTERVRGKVLPEVLEKVEAICALINELLPRVEGNVQQRHVVLQTATD